MVSAQPVVFAGLEDYRADVCEGAEERRGNALKGNFGFWILNFEFWFYGPKLTRMTGGYFEDKKENPRK